MTIPTGTNVKALRYAGGSGTALDRGTVIESDSRADRITVRFTDGETANFSGQGIHDYVTVSPLSESVAVGDIYRASWGYDQTNIDFYEVTAVTAKTMQLRPIAARRTPGERDMSETVEPIPGKFTGEPFRRRFISGSNRFIAIDSVAIASQWDGRAATATHTH